jgi:DNA-directed RNA polymerase specialized sigma24 family protein
MATRTMLATIEFAASGDALLEDDVLFDAWRRGDARAADALVRRHDALVRRYLARRVGDHLDDAVQNVWVAIAKSHDRFERRSTFRAYLLGVLRNQTYEAQRQLVRRRRHDPHAEVASRGATWRPSCSSATTAGACTRLWRHSARRRGG